MVVMELMFRRVASSLHVHIKYNSNNNNRSAMKFQKIKKRREKGKLHSHAHTYQVLYSVDSTLYILCNIRDFPEQARGTVASLFVKKGHISHELRIGWWCKPPLP
jgi:hypothetical protein